MTTVEAAPVDKKDNDKATTLDNLIESFWDADARYGVDVVFSFDTTGSMQGCLGEVRRQVSKVCGELMREISNVHIGIITHGDYCDDGQQSWCPEGMIQVLPFTSNEETLMSHIRTVGNTGGEGAHAAYEWVLFNANNMKWRSKATKALVMIGDVVPNAPSRTELDIYWRTEMNCLYRRGVKIYGVHAYPSPFGEAFYQELARRTGGAYLPLRHFGLITDMMLAIAHREAGMLEEYKRKTEGNQDANYQHMIQTLERKLSSVRVRDPGDAWWDIKFDKLNIVYVRNKDRFARTSKQMQPTRSRYNADGSKTEARNGFKIGDHIQQVIDKTKSEDQGYSQRTGGKIMDDSHLTVAQKITKKENREKVMGTTDSGFRLIEVKPKVFEFVDKATYEKMLAAEAGGAPGPLQQQRDQDRFSERRRLIQAEADKKKALVDEFADKVTLSKSDQQKTAIARLMRDLKEIHKTPLYGVSALPLEKNMMEWHANITGPKNTEYDNVIFHLVLKFPSSYPRKPPTVQICTRLLHPNVFGHWVCLDMLEIGAFGSAEEADRINTGWSSGYSVLSILLQLQTFLFTDSLADEGKDAEIYKLPQHVKAATRLADSYKCQKCSHGKIDDKKDKIVWPPFANDVPEANIGGKNPTGPKKKKANPDIEKPKEIESIPSAPEPTLSKKFPAPANKGFSQMHTNFFTIGMPVEGTVLSVREGLGAFVDVGSIFNAMLHISEMSSTRMNSVYDITAVGQKIFAYVKSVDRERGRIGLTLLDPLKSEQRNQPSIDIRRLKEGTVRIGRVSRRENYGVFLNIGVYTVFPDRHDRRVFVNALLSSSSLVNRERPVVWSAADVFEDGELVRVVIKSVRVGDETQRAQIDVAPVPLISLPVTDQKNTEILPVSTTASANTTGLCSLDVHTLFEIMKYLNPIAMGRLGMTCKMLRKFSDDGISYLWERNEIVCFHSKRHFSDDTLGIGVNLESKMNGKLAYITCTYDLVSHSSFRDEEVRKASYKEKFSHWVPVFIEPGHGKKAMTLAKQYMAQICTECYGSFQPWMVLEIMPKLMNTMVVSVMSGKLYGSIMALEGYCGFHHMFLNLMEEYPELRQKADEIIKNFIDDPRKRHKREVPALGEFLPLLTITETYKWEDVAIPYLLEMFDRNVLWTLKKFPNLAVPGVVNDEKRLRDTFEATTVSNHLLMFHVYFLKHLARPDGMNLKQVSDLLNLRYGRPTYAMKDQLLNEVKAIRKLKTWDGFFKKINIPKPKDHTLIAWLHSAINNSARKRYHRHYDYVSRTTTINYDSDDDGDYDQDLETLRNKRIVKEGGMKGNKAGKSIDYEDHW